MPMKSKQCKCASCAGAACKCGSQNAKTNGQTKGCNCCGDQNQGAVWATACNCSPTCSCKIS